MSNLKLPDLSASELLCSLAKTRNYKEKVIAYETTAAFHPADDNESSMIVIRHHGNRIAEITDDTIYITNAGWDTKTTRQRINAIMRDNDVPYSVSQKNWNQILTGPEGIIGDGFHNLLFDRETKEIVSFVA